MQREDGGPAFPSDDECCWGMSLREYFAGQALAGLMGNPHTMTALARDNPDDVTVGEIAGLAADSLLRYLGDG